MDVKKDNGTISFNELRQKKCSTILGLDDVIGFLASPDTGAALQMTSCKSKLTDGINDYDIRENLPILMPSKLNKYFTTHLQVPLQHYQDSFLQYFLLATIKQSGEINAQPTEQAAQKHFYRMSQFLSDSKGITLDVGCDDPELSSCFFSDSVQYIGLDPFCTRSNPFRIIGVGEYLPFTKESVDNVVFNTSLDHILDWRRAISQAYAVLKKGGSLYIATYIWADKADLIHDSVHFHHFRYYEILGALEELNFIECGSQIYESPKGDVHRHGLYLKAIKK